MQKLNKAITSLLWCKKRPCIALSKLHPPKGKGGANLHDIRMYNLTCLLRYGLDWVSQSSIYANYTLESSLASPYHLSGILHSKIQPLPKDLQNNILIRDTVIAWWEIRKKLHLPPTSLDPRQSHVSSSNEIQGYDIWRIKGLVKTTSLFHLDTMKPKPFYELMIEFQLPSMHLLYHNQELSYTTYSCQDASKRFRLSMIDRLLNKCTYPISDIYKSLRSDINTNTAKVLFKNWHKGLPEVYLCDKFLEGYLKLCKCIINETWRETQFKLIHRAFIPFLSSNSPSHLAAYPQCGSKKPSLFHRFWLCPPISTFWDHIITFIHRITELLIPKTPQLLLFSYSLPKHPHPEELRICISQWTHLCLLAARKNIFKVWTTSHPPTISAV